jgi:hypothetical protein
MGPHLAAIVVLLSLSTLCAGFSEEAHGRVLLQDTTADGRALLQFKKYALEGDFQNGALSTWGSNTSSYCDWAGVVCNTETPRRVIALNITDIALNGYLGSVVANLSFLESLTLSSTNLQGIIPPAFGMLSNLRILELFNNRLTGSIPPELAGCKNLTSLFLEQNLLSGFLPPELGSLRQLETLNFKGNHIDGTLPDSLGNCVNQSHSGSCKSSAWCIWASTCSREELGCWGIAARFVSSTQPVQWNSSAISRSTMEFLGGLRSAEQ